MRLSVIALAIICAVPAAARAGDLTVTVDEVQDARGSVLGALYNSEATFLNQPSAVARFKVKSTPGQVQYTFHNLPAGTYAFTTFQDSNDNGKLDRNELSIPTEGYGFSNDAQGSGGPPKFGQAAFAFDGKDKQITVTLNY